MYRRIFFTCENFRNFFLENFVIDYFFRCFKLRCFDCHLTFTINYKTVPVLPFLNPSLIYLFSCFSFPGAPYQISVLRISSQAYLPFLSSCHRTTTIFVAQFDPVLILNHSPVVLVKYWFEYLN